MNYLEKKANSPETGLDVELGGHMNRSQAGSFGKMMAALNGGPIILKGLLGDTYDYAKNYKRRDVSLRSDDSKAQLYKNLADFMYDADPVNLSNTKVYLGGGNYKDKLKRIWQNKRTSIIAKLIGTGLTPIETWSADMLRSDHYDPLSDTVTLYSDNPAVLTHELGHAVDMNSWRNPAKDKPAKSKIGKVLKALKGEIKALPHDAYSLGRAVINEVGPILGYSAPGVGALTGGLTLGIEGAANIRGLRRLERLKEKYPELVKNLKTLRGKTLPAAYSTYVLNGLLKSHPGTYELIDELGPAGAALLQGLTVGTAGTVRVGSSLLTKGKYKDAYKSTKEQLKEYSKIRKQENKIPSLKEMLSDPDKFDKEQADKILQRELKQLLDKNNADVEKLINALAKNNGEEAEKIVEKNPSIVESLKNTQINKMYPDVTTKAAGLNATCCLPLTKKAIAVEDIEDESDLKDMRDYYKTLSNDEKAIILERLSAYAKPGRKYIQTLLGALRGGSMLGLAGAGTLGTLARSSAKSASPDPDDANTALVGGAALGGTIGGSIGLLTGGIKGYRTAKKYSENAKKLLELLNY